MEPSTSTSKTNPKTESAIDVTASKKTKAPKKAMSSKPTKPKPEKVDNPVVFAFRLSTVERTRIHEAAGSGKASQFVLAAALAAADGDVESFKKVLTTRAAK